ncbi:O-linked-mannose beta-1-2-N-acetylglucosaminyltransferase 1-like 25 [Homarus americanus]|uniref:Alpha-1,3-mannosyl-glycoprotein 2-beta-N-acetylglucosaminyltransferase n=2 Tax=Homarus americanus TaxID=6706 RepID=A0A8J5JQS8_HOMAM|nr:O-linked-mannose beta-1-2-N-acetylglucosaminyltransferase 1-like 25 [Homarus americanus]
MEKAGLYFVLLNQYDGSVIMNKVFNFHEYAYNVGVPSLFTSLSSGRIMVLAVKLDAGLNMPQGVRQLLQEFGSRWAHHLHFRSYLAWVLTSRGPTLGEGNVDPYEITTENEDVDNLETWTNEGRRDGPVKVQSNIFASPVYLEVTVPLVIEGDCWGERERAVFCRSHDGYGDLCHCQHPAPLTYHPHQLENTVIDNVPVVIVASSRPQELYRCLVTVLRQEGGDVSRVLVLLDGYNTELIALLQLLGVKYQVNNMEGRTFISRSARISHHYRFSLHALFNSFPNASKAIVLEEDLLVSPDFFSYFNQTSWLLEADPSIFCISAWNDLGALHTATHPSRLYRVETHAGYGWMLTRELFDFIYPIWPSPYKNHDWDIWLRSPNLRAGRECVVPDVSRTFHNGMMGTHIKGVMTHSHFTAHPVTAVPAIPLHNVHRMKLDEYEEDLYHTLEGDTVYFLNSTHHPCTESYIPRNFTAGPVVLFISMTSDNDYPTWLKFGACLGVWNIDIRSHHRGMFRFTFYNTELFIIGYPFSDYSYLKPSWVHVIKRPTEWEMGVMGIRVTENRWRYRRPELEVLSPYLLTERSTPKPAFTFM